MVRKHYFVPRPETAWLTGVLFERNDTQVLVELAPRGNEIVFRARGVEKKELLSIIAADLDALNHTFKGLEEKVTVLIPCICDVCTKSEPKFFEESDLKQRKKVGKQTIECSASYEAVNVLELLDGVKAEKMPDWAQEKQSKSTKVIHVAGDYYENGRKIDAGIYGEGDISGGNIAGRDVNFKGR